MHTSIHAPGTASRLLPAAVATAIVCLAASPAIAQLLPPIPEGGIVIALEPVASGLVSPVAATHANDGSGRLFVVDQAGFIRIVDASGVLLPEPFLDLTDRMIEPVAFFDERGLLGLAFHPSYAQNGRFFVRYGAPREGADPEPCFVNPAFWGCHREVLSEFRVSAFDPDRADPESERVLLSIDQPEFNHNAGDVRFGPAREIVVRTAPGSAGGQAAPAPLVRSFLFFSLGDGGGANDGLDQPGLPHGPIGNGLNRETLLGSLLRIDVDAPPDPGLEYAIPPDNPFADGPGADELYAYGFRNPFRFSFDIGPGGGADLFLADVGQDLFEEIDVVEAGGNYGWATREGSACFDPFDTVNPPAACATTGPDGEPLKGPVAEYDHSQGIAVVGGFVYRGGGFPELRGKYVFGDFSRGFFLPDGRLFWLDADGDRSRIFEFVLDTPGGELDRFLKGFGRDGRGEIYVLTSTALGPVGATGEVFRIVKP